MENFNKEKTSCNIRLLKIMGLYQILDPKSDKLLGYNIYHIAVILAMLYICPLSVMLFVNGIYYWNYHKVESILYLSEAGYILFSCYKMMTIIRYSDQLWECLSTTRFDLLSCGGQYNKPMEVCRKRSILYIYTYAVFSYSSVLCWVICPLLLNKIFFTMTDFKGSTSNYRMNVVNFYAFISDETYNEFFSVFYVIETVFTILMIMFLNIFDIHFITMCMAISGQLQTICFAFKSVGHGEFQDLRLPRTTKNSNSNDEVLHVHDNVYTKLKTIIMDHQVVIKNQEIFINIIGKTILFQIAQYSFSFTIATFTAAMCLIDEEMPNSKVVLIKMIVIFPALLFEIFMACYLFGNIHYWKESIVFALYSSNWTEMDMKCKKLILLAMRMNAHQQKLKFTTTRIVNLEMFCNTMRVCYTVTSMLIKYKKSLDK